MLSTLDRLWMGSLTGLSAVSSRRPVKSARRPVSGRRDTCCDKVRLSKKAESVCMRCLHSRSCAGGVSAPRLVKPSSIRAVTASMRASTCRRTCSEFLVISREMCLSTSAHAVKSSVSSASMSDGRSDTVSAMRSSSVNCAVDPEGGRREAGRETGFEAKPGAGMLLRTGGGAISCSCSMGAAALCGR